MNLRLRLKKAIKDFVFFLLERLSPFYDRNRPFDPKTLVKNILIFEGGGIGDLIRIFPAIHVLSTHFPKASLSIVVAKNSREALTLYPKKEIFSKIFEYDLKGSHRGVLRKLSFVSQLRKNHYDILYIPSRGEGMRELSLMAFLTGIPVRIGFKKKGAGSFHTIKAEFQENMPILNQNLFLLKIGGFPVTDEKIQINIPEEDLNFAEGVIDRKDSFSFITVHPGASWYGDYRTWRIENFILLIKELLKEWGGIVICIGSQNEKEMGDQLSHAVNRSSLINMIGKTTPSQAAALLKRSDVFIGNDSGPLHMALALGIPSVALFGPTSPLQVIGEEYKNNCFIVRKNMACSPCYLHQKDYVPSCKQIDCMEAISVEDVMKAVRDLKHRIQEKDHD